MEFWHYILTLIFLFVLLASYILLRGKKQKQRISPPSLDSVHKINTKLARETKKQQISPPSLDSVLLQLENAIHKLNLINEKKTELLMTVHSLRETLHSPLLITVLGEFSSGKSTFINALLGQKLLPMKQRETTATITKLQYGLNRKLIVYYKDGRVENHNIDSNGLKDLDSFIVENFQESDNILDLIRQVTIELNSDILRSIDIADTPGFNSKYNRHTEITTEFIKYSDLVIWLFSAKQIGKASEIQSLQEHCKFFKPIGIVNQIDRLNLKEGETVQSNLGNALAKFDGLFEKLFFVSALQGLDSTNSNYAISGIPEFLNYLNETIIPQAKTRKEMSILNKLIRIGEELKQHLAEIRKQSHEVRSKIQDIKSMESTIKDWNSKWDQIYKQFERDSQLDIYERLNNISRYFLITEAPRKIVTKAQKYIDDRAEIDSIYEELDKEEMSLDNWKQQLDADYADWQNKFQTYSNKAFGFKHFGDDIIESLFGSPWSQEKTILNQMAKEYDKSADLYNVEVDKYNYRLQRTNDRASKLDESVTHFINNVLTRSIDKQLDMIKALEKQFQSKEAEYQDLISHQKRLEKDIMICHKEIFPIFQQTAHFIKTAEHILEKQITDFGELITYLVAQIEPTETVDWSRIYNRNTIEKVMELRFKEATEVQFSAPKEMNKENRKTKLV